MPNLIQKDSNEKKNGLKPKILKILDSVEWYS